MGRQEIEVKDGAEHVAFTCAKIGSMLDISDSEDPEGLKALYYLVQDLRCLVFSLIAVHFKVRAAGSVCSCYAHETLGLRRLCADQAHSQLITGRLCNELPVVSWITDSARHQAPHVEHDGVSSVK